MCPDLFLLSVAGNSGWDWVESGGSSDPLPTPIILCYWRNRFSIAGMVDRPWGDGQRESYRTGRMDLIFQTTPRTSQTKTDRPPHPQQREDAGRRGNSQFVKGFEHSEQSLLTRGGDWSWLTASKRTLRLHNNTSFCKSPFPISEQNTQNCLFPFPWSLQLTPYPKPSFLL